MAIITGTVDNVNVNANGIYSLTVDGIRYGTYKDKPPCSEGDYITFSAVQKGQYWNANAKTIQRAGGESPQQAPAPQPSSGSSPTAPRSTYVPATDRNDSIVFQSSRKDALQFVGMLLDKDLIDLGKGKGADKIQMMEDYVDNYTERFVSDVKNLGHKSEEETSVSSSDPVDDFPQDKDIPF